MKAAGRCSSMEIVQQSFSLAVEQFKRLNKSSCPLAEWVHNSMQPTCADPPGNTFQQSHNA